jgi:1-acyl-sn-glycerol-3-phosphate acyltransferase
MSRARAEMEPVYGLFHGLSRLVYQMFFRGDVAGLENLPRTGGYIVAVNHGSPRSWAFSSRIR